MRRVISLVALSAFGLVGVVAQDPACLESCVTTTSGKFTEFGCVDAVQEGCLCVVPNYQYSVRDCGVQNCGADQNQALDHLFNPTSGFCKAHPRPESEVSTTAEPTATTEEPVSTTEQPATTEEPVITTEEPVTTTEEPVPTTEPSEEATTIPEEQTSTSAPEATTSASESESTDAVESTSAISTSEPSSTEDAGASTTSGTSGSDEDEDADESQGGGGGGLSSGAAAGIGVGVGVIVIAVAVVGVVIFLRRRRNRPRGQSVGASRPMPPSSGGRSYPSVDHGSFGEKGRGGESIELQTNRYEDMPPRQTPRIMV